MGKDGMQYAMRMIGIVGKVNQQNLMGGRLEDEDWSKITTALGLLSDAPIFIDETPDFNVFDLCSRVHQLFRQNDGLGLVIIDHLQLIKRVGQSVNRATDIGEIINALQKLAIELQIPVIILSQMNCCQDCRQDKRPLISDLDDSDVLERNADIILLIHREEYYSNDPSNKGKAEVCVVKNQHGTTGSIPLLFMNDYSRFENVLSHRLLLWTIPQQGMVRLALHLLLTHRQLG